MNHTCNLIHYAHLKRFKHFIWAHSH